MVLYDNLASLNSYLAGRSYISGYQVSDLDFEVFESFSSPPSHLYPHFLRWFNHISALSQSRQSSSLESPPEPAIFPTYTNGKTEKYIATIQVKTKDHSNDMERVDRYVRGIALTGLEWGESLTEEGNFGVFSYKIACVLSDVIDIDDVITRITQNQQLEAEVTSFQTL